MNQKNTKFQNGMIVAEKHDGSCVVIFTNGMCAVVNNKGVLESMTDLHTKPMIRKPIWLKYFGIIGKAERDIVSEWIVKQERTISFVRNFLYDVMVALTVINKDYMIALIEPSVTSDDKLCYKEGEDVCINKRNIWWEQNAISFASEYGSRLANRYELLLFYAYRIAIGEWTLREVCYNSSGIGNFYDAPGKSNDIEKSGIREVGGVRDGIGNTHKLVKTGYDFEHFGGCYRNYGKLNPVAKNMGKPIDFGLNYNSGVVVLTKIDKLIGAKKL